jgi:hypothetical protein
MCFGPSPPPFPLHRYGNYDFIHPLDSGHRLIADLVAGLLQQASLQMVLQPWNELDQEVRLQEAGGVLGAHLRGAHAGVGAGVAPGQGWQRCAGAGGGERASLRASFRAGPAAVHSSCIVIPHAHRDPTPPVRARVPAGGGRAAAGTHVAG